MCRILDLPRREDDGRRPAKLLLDEKIDERAEGHCKKDISNKVIDGERDLADEAFAPGHAKQHRPGHHTRDEIKEKSRDDGVDDIRQNSLLEANKERSRQADDSVRYSRHERPLRDAACSQIEEENTQEREQQSADRSVSPCQRHRRRQERLHIRRPPRGETPEEADGEGQDEVEEHDGPLGFGIQHIVFIEHFLYYILYF